MKILVDLDAVCCDTNGAVLEWYNKRYDDNVGFEDQKDFMLYRACPKVDPEVIKERFNSEEFFFNLPVMPNCVEVLQRLQREGHEIIVLTAVPKQSKTGLYDKRRWVWRHLSFLPRNNLVATHRKEVVKGDILFDDGPLNLRVFEGLTCAFDYPYNRETRTDYRVSGWLEFERIIKVLEKVY